MTPFDRWIAIAFPWLTPTGADWRNLKAAFEAGWNAAKEDK